MTSRGKKGVGSRYALTYGFYARVAYKCSLPDARCRIITEAPSDNPPPPPSLICGLLNLSL